MEIEPVSTASKRLLHISSSIPDSITINGAVEYPNAISVSSNDDFCVASAGIITIFVCIAFIFVHQKLTIITDV